MDQADITATLRRVENLTAFAEASRIALSTLNDLKAGNRKARKGTLLLVSTALKRFKPALKPEDPGETP